MKILIIGPSWVGDMVMAQSLFKALRQRHEMSNQEELTIDVLAPAWSGAILERMPEVRQCIEMPIGHGKLNISGRRSLGKGLRDQKYDQAIVLPNSLKSALIPFFADIPKRTGWRGEMRYGLLNDLRNLDKQVYPLMVQRFVALAHDKKHSVPRADDILKPHLQVNLSNQQNKLVKWNLNQDKPILALCPGAEFGIAKRWPEEHYAEIARQYIERGGQVWLFGSNKDHEVAELIIHKIPRGENACINLAGKTALADAIDLLALADKVVSNDSGLMHIAAALQRPLVVVYGSTSPAFTPPLGDCVQIVTADIECSPCFKRECPFGHYRCLKELAPEQISSALVNLSPASSGKT